METTKAVCVAKLKLHNSSKQTHTPLAALFTTLATKT